MQASTLFSARLGEGVFLLDVGRFRLKKFPRPFARAMQVTTGITGLRDVKLGEEG